jgi:heme/copper-type cytochrome/quinol oxidase subunit 2
VSQLVAVAPATLFMTSLFLRSIQSQDEEPARTAHRVVMWYGDRPWTLWVLLILLPVAGLMAGFAVLRLAWRHDHELQKAVDILRRRAATVIVTAVTVASAAILGIVALHMLTT